MFLPSLRGVIIGLRCYLLSGSGIFKLLPAISAGVISMMN